jgi:hypothetical protein
VVAHKIGSLLPADGKDPQFAQLYIHDTAREVDNRLKKFSSDGECSVDGGCPAGADPQIVAELLDMLNEHNKLVQEPFVMSQKSHVPEENLKEEIGSIQVFFIKS